MRAQCATNHRCAERILFGMLRGRLDDASHRRALRGGEVRIRGGLRMPTDDDPAPRTGAPRAKPATEDLLRRYRRRRSVLLRDLIVERHRVIVETMARRLALRLPPSVDAQDLVHAGIWGLMQAIDKFEPRRCSQFTPFMRIRVRGAMLDELRALDWLPRLWRRRLRDREQALARLRGGLLREPDEHELAQELGVSVARLHRAYRAGVGVHGLRAVHGDGDDDDGDAMDHLADDALESPIESIHRQELLALVRQSLQPVEWRVLQLHYFEGMSGREVARRLRLSASRICQIHCRVLDRLKNRLAAMAV
jgi:RNA polymerase sigma factor for flagellar operon FliA